MQARTFFLYMSICLTSYATIGQSIDTYIHSIDSLRAQKGYTDALAKVNEAILRYPGNLPLLKAKGCILSDLRRHNEAVEVFTAYLKKKPNDVAVLALRGNSRYLSQDPEMALVDYNRSIQLDPTRPEAFYLRGRYYTGKRDDKSAKNDYLRVYKMDSNYLLVRHNLGNIYRRLGVFDSAVFFFSKVLQSDPDNADYIKYRAECRYEIGDNKGSLDDALRLMELDPDELSAPWIAGLASWELRKYDETLKYLNMCVARDSANTNFFWARSVVYDTLKNYQESLTDLNKCIELDSSSAKYYLTRGFMQLIKFENFKAALNDYNRAIQLEPNYGKAYLYRGMFYADFSSNREQACADLKKAHEYGYDPKMETYKKYCQ